MGKRNSCLHTLHADKQVAVGWSNGSIVNPTLMPSSVGCEKHAFPLENTRSPVETHEVQWKHKKPSESTRYRVKTQNTQRKVRKS